MELKGIFIYSKTANGNYNFRLKAPNKETLAVSEAPYPTSTGCKSGIASCRKFADVHVEDQTLKRGYTVLPNPKYEMYEDKAGKFRYRLRANNGIIIIISEAGYATREGCKKGIVSVSKWAATADIEADPKN